MHACTYETNFLVNLDCWIMPKVIIFSEPKKTHLTLTSYFKTSDLMEMVGVFMWKLSTLNFWLATRHIVSLSNRYIYFSIMLFFHNTYSFFHCHSCRSWVIEVLLKIFYIYSFKAICAFRLSFKNLSLSFFKNISSGFLPLLCLSGSFTFASGADLFESGKDNWWLMTMLQIIFLFNLSPYALKWNMGKTPEKVTKDPKHVEAARKHREKYTNKLRESILNDIKKYQYYQYKQWNYQPCYQCKQWN